MALRPIGAATSLATAAGAATTSSAFVVQSDTVRIVAIGQPAHVVVDHEPSAVVTDFVVVVGEPEELKMTKGSQRVVGITTGTSTILTCPEGTQMPFAVGDRVTLSEANLSDCTDAISHVEVTAVNRTAGVDGNHQTSITVDANTAGIVTAFSAANLNSTLRRSFKLSALSQSGTVGTVYFQQVQRS